MLSRKETNASPSSPSSLRTGRGLGGLKETHGARCGLGVKFNATILEDLSSQAGIPVQPSSWSRSSSWGLCPLHVHPMTPEKRYRLQFPPPGQLHILGEAGPDSVGSAGCADGLT